LSSRRALAVVLLAVISQLSPAQAQAVVSCVSVLAPVLLALVVLLSFLLAPARRLRVALFR
jgi:hypothetical protein